jgi:hypothetical protein
LTITDGKRDPLWRRSLAAIHLTFFRMLRFIRVWFWQALVVAFVIYFIVLYVRPLSSLATPDGDDVGRSWNESLERLGIIPVFPPQEDFYVGDVWAVAESSDRTSEQVQGNSVRIGHIDLRKDMEEERKYQFIFSDTGNLSSNDSFRRQDPAEIQVSAPSSRVYLTLTAFPGLSISRTSHASGSLGWSIGGLGSGRDDTRLEEIRIPVAETYGASPVAAFIKLDDWCAGAYTKIFCTDSFLRRILAYSIGERVLAARNGRYLVRLQLRLVTRVLLAREIEQRRLISDANGILIQPAARAAKSVGPTDVKPEGVPSSSDSKSLEERGGRSVNDLTQNANAASAAGPLSAAISQFISGGTDIAVHQAFQRPIAFGYRAITISVLPSAPSEGASQ